MKVNCTYCHSKIEFDEKEYAPGDVVTVECRRCGEEMSVTIPPRDDDAASEKAEENKVAVRRVAEEPNSETEEMVQDKPVVPKPEGSAAIPPKPRKPRKAAGKKETETSLSVSNAEATKPKTPKPEATNPDVPIPEASRPKKPRASRKPKEKTGNVPPVISKSAKPQSNGNGGCANWMILLVLAILAGLCVWLFRSCGGNKQASEADTIGVVEEAPAEVEVIEEAEDIVEDTAVADTVAAVAAEVVEAPVAETEVKRIYLPAVSKYSSSEAYEVYPAYVTEEKFGDAWATVDVVQDAVRNGMVECFVRGEGDIEGYPLSIDAVRLKDGRLYGRYHNDYNGVKLDINGGFDSNDDLIIKLGHKSETSYWVLRFVGTCEDGSLQYRGTWGRKDKPTSLKISIRDK